MFDPKKLLDDLLGSKIPGTGVHRPRQGRPGRADGQGQSARRGRAGRRAARHRARDARSPARRSSSAGSPPSRASPTRPTRTTRAAASPAPASRVPASRANPNCCRRPSDTEFDPSQAPQGEAEFSLALVRAMIAAAKADGHIDDAERKKIGDKLTLAGIGSGSRAVPAATSWKSRSTSTNWSALAHDRGAARRALHRLAADDRAGHARRARLSRPAGRSAAAAGRAGRPYRGDGFGRQGTRLGRCIQKPRANLGAADLRLRSRWRPGPLVTRSGCAGTPACIR